MRPRPLLIIALIGTLTLTMLGQSHVAKATCVDTYDLTVSNGGLTVDTFGGVASGSWVSGQGWTETEFTAGTNTYRSVYAHLAWGGAEISSITMTFDITKGYVSAGSGSDVAFYITTSPGGGHQYGDTFTALTSGTGKTLTYTFTPSSGITSITVSIASDNRQSGDSTPLSGSGAIKSLSVTRSSCTPTQTPTPTSTFTPSPTPIPIAVPPGFNPTTGGGCIILSKGQSTFSDLSQWELTPSTLTHPTGGTGLELSPEGSASLTDIKLDKNSKYAIYATFHTTAPRSGDSFGIALGKTSHNLDIANTSGSQSYSGTPQNYLPDNGELYTLTIDKISASPDPDLIIDSICVEQVAEDGSGVVAAPVIVEQSCQNCIYTPVGDLFQDIPKIIAWLWCGFWNLWTCVLAGILNGLWQSVVNVITFLAMLWLWITKVLSGVINWVLGNLRVVAFWAGGWLYNVIQSVINLALRILNGLGITEFINAILAFLLGLPTLAVTTAQSIVSLLSTIIQIAGTVINIAITLAGQVINAIGSLMAVIPEMILSIINGFNNSSTIPAYAPNCNDQNTLFWYPCLGMFVADNTVMDGPVYYLLPVTMGFAGFNTILWAMREVREVLERS